MTKHNELLLIELSGNERSGAQTHNSQEKYSVSFYFHSNSRRYSFNKHICCIFTIKSYANGRHISGVLIVISVVL